MTEAEPGDLSVRRAIDVRFRVTRPVRAATRRLWLEQDRHPGDRSRLYRAISEEVAARNILYPGSYVDVAASFVFPRVTYVDVDRRAAQFFGDVEGVAELIAEWPDSPVDAEVRFVNQDYAEGLGLPEASFDLLVSLYAGFVSEHCTKYLRIGGTLLVNPSHGDAALASIDPRYQLSGVVVSHSGRYSVRTSNLDRYLVPKRDIQVTSELIHRTGRGVPYTRSPFAYLFTRVG